MYLYELTLNENQRCYQCAYESILWFAKTHKIRRVLDYGGGIGGLTLYLNSRGVKCDYADVPGLTWDYAQYRFNRANIKASLFSENELRKGKWDYDLVISLDCLEHLHPLVEYVKFFNSIMKPNGSFISQSAFYGIGLHIEANHQFNSFTVFNEMLTQNGFLFKGQLAKRGIVTCVIPPAILNLLNKRSISGKKLVYAKK